MKTLEQDLQDLMATFKNVAEQNDPCKGDGKLDKAVLKGKQEALFFAANKVKNLLQWHGLLPGGFPVRS